MIPKITEPAAIEKWLRSIQHHLDNPEVFVPEMNSVIHDWEEKKDCTKIAMVAPVEYSAFIANLGVAILYDNLNNRRNDIVCERVYYPEAKLKRRMVKERVPLFSKETFRPLKDFDIIAISSYYPLQYFGYPDIIQMGAMHHLSAERKEEDPIVITGGVATFNPAPIHKFVDAVFFGDGEGQLEHALEIYHEMKEEGATKKEILSRWIVEVQGCYVPAFYEETYKEVEKGRPLRVEAHTPLFDFAPKKIKKSIADLSLIKPLTKMFVSNSEGSEMSAGSLEITRGCSNKCSFCEGTYRSQPFRERKIEDIKAGFTELIQNTGAKAVTPYGFNLSDHHKINEIIYFLLEDEGRKVSMSSQHLNKFTEEFAMIAYASGNRSITVAIETASENMRSKVSKNLNEETILDAFKTIFNIGFNKVKVYMIANLPGETQEDIDYLVILANKIHGLQKEIQGDAMKTQIRFSWTPFNSKAHTPLQFAEVYKIDEEGLPILPKTLGTVLEGLRELGYGFRVGTDSELSVVNQCISLGDRRMADVIEDCYLNPEFNYKGGMSIGFKKPMAKFLTMLKARGLDYEHFMREKDKDEVFAWDFINMGITKRFLTKAYFESFANAVDEPQCEDACARCGGCTPISNEYFKKARAGLLPEDKADTLELLEKRFKKQTVEKLRFRVRVNEDFRYIHSSKIKNFIRRAFLRVGLPAKSKITLSSDKLKFSNWSYGVEYGEALLWTRTHLDKDIVQKLNETFTDVEPLKFEIVETFSDSAGMFMNSFDDILYRFNVPSSDKSFSQIKELIDNCLSSKEFIIRLKVLGEKRDSTITIDFDARPLIKDIWLVKTATGTDVYSILKEKVGVYELYPAVFKTTKRNILKYPVERVEYILNTNEDAFDMFAELCEVCGEEIQENVLGEKVHEDRCMRHQYTDDEAVKIDFNRESLGVQEIDIDKEDLEFAFADEPQIKGDHNEDEEYDDD